jgi:hypothetical protein
MIFLQFGKKKSRYHHSNNINKLDKGCLIFNINKEGDKVLSVDSNRYDANIGWRISWAWMHWPMTFTKTI